ncbi:antitoxin VbhA family protein [Curtobacterium flaccumfaciens]|uniref:antitoxin VbhA family protein n=1 Tax=Curtobacterium flaccumfaciens TaxID=2035 RepID=UPI00188D709C|nr:antitoxin VbhA family protein [Curtobacterium flaccumfaciens]MBF4595634.1 antitoxin VbhA family protein [Curtobacterium flaccumfaciens]
MSIKTDHDTARTVDVEQEMALVEKGQQLAGHFPDAEALARARRILEGTLSPEDARAEVAAKHGFPLRQR